MRDTPHHKPRFLRAAAILAWAFQGLLAPWLPAPGYAANPDTLRLGVHAISTAPPTAISDLLASPNLAIPGQVSLTWTAPQGYADIANSTVGSYSIHYATYSVDSLLGDTTSWWNSTMASSTTLQPPGYTPQPPGSLEAYTFTGLNPGTTYYFGIRSTSPTGTLSVIDTKSSTAGQQAFALTSTGSLSPPATFTGVALSSTSIQWSWSPVAGATAYQVYSHPANVLLQTLAAPTTFWIESGLTPNTAYTRKARATNGVSTSGDSPTATVTTPPPPSTATPRVPNGLLSTQVSNGLQVTLSWTPVTFDTSGNPITIDHYAIYRYAVIGDTPTVVGTVVAPTAAYTENTNGLVYFYRIQAVANTGGVSGLSDYLDSSRDGNRYALASDDPSTRVVMPHDAALYLLAANNPYGTDLDVVLIHQPQDEVNVTLRSYKVSARKPDTGELLTTFAFPQNNISVQMGLGSAISSPHFSPDIQQKISNIAQAGGAGSIAQIVSVYWFNGSSFVSVGEPTLTSGQAIAVTVRNLGIYQIRAITLGVKFRLAQGSPYPRVITPNGAENHRVFWFFDNPASDTVTGSIYDIRGAKVRDLTVNSMSPTPNSLVWDGRDSRGAVVPSGIYLYKISSTDQTITGTVVVAR